MSRCIRWSLLLVSLSALARPVAAQADTTVARILKFRDSIEAQSKIFKFGVSVGWRHALASTGTPYRDATIDPTTNRVTVDSTDSGDFVVSGTVTAFPWAKTDATGKPAAFARAVGFLANINVATIGSENLSTFNKSIEGGFGIAFRVATDFALGATIERKFSRRLRDFVKPNSVLVVDGDTITTLTKDDNRFFRDDNLTALSFKFLYFLK
jgi:hypothetical protein